jgi:hypothetical protein
LSAQRDAIGKRKAIDDAWLCKSEARRLEQPFFASVRGVLIYARTFIAVAQRAGGTKARILLFLEGTRRH